MPDALMFETTVPITKGSSSLGTSPVTRRCKARSPTPRMLAIDGSETLGESPSSGPRHPPPDGAGAGYTDVQPRVWRTYQSNGLPVRERVLNPVLN